MPTLKERRLALNLSRDKLGILMGVSESAILNAEAGRGRYIERVRAFLTECEEGRIAIDSQVKCRIVLPSRRPRGFIMTPEESEEFDDVLVPGMADYSSKHKPLYKS